MTLWLHNCLTKGSCPSIYQCKGVWPFCWILWTHFSQQEINCLNYFLAALSSSRSLVVGRLVGPLVMFLKKWPLEYQKVIKTYLCTYLWYSSDSCDSSDSSDSSDSNDSNNSSDSSDQITLYTKKFYLPKTYLPTYLCDGSYCRDISGSIESSDSSNQKNFLSQKKMFSTRKLFFTKKSFSHQKSRNLFRQTMAQLLHTQKITQSLNKNIARIAKRCPENITSVVKCV